MLLDMATEWLTSKLLKLFNQNGGSSSSGGGIFSNLLGGIKSIFGGGGSSGGGLFSGSQGGGAYSFNGAINNLSHTSGSAPGQVIVSGNGAATGSSGGLGLAGGVAIAGAAANLIGGLIGGRTGSFISNIGTGAALGAQIGSIIPGIGTAIGAAIGAAGGFFASLLGGDPKRKRDKNEKIPQLQKDFSDALAQFNQLITDTNALKIDPPESALAKALELRSQIASGFGIKMESKKYAKIQQEQIAAQLLSIDKQPDGLMAQLTKAVERAKEASETRKGLGVAEFANGVFMSEAFKRRNGMLRGMWTGQDTLPSMLAAGEMVLNPSQQNRVRAVSGFDPFEHAGIPGYAGGTFVAPASSAAGGARPQVNVTVVLNNSGLVESDILDVLVEGMDSNDVSSKIVETYDKAKSRKR